MPDLDITTYAVHPLLGRHRVIDPRSAAYRRPYTGQPLKPAEWEPKIPVLDQQDLLQQNIHTSAMFDGVEDVDALGSCTANAATAVLSCIADADTLTTAGLNLTDAAACEEWAIRLYADATRADEWLEYQWPTDDCGSSGLGVAKALKSRDLIHQYGHAFSVEELAQLLQTGPVLAGLPWRSAWFEPVGANALLDDIPGWQDSEIAGGHEVAIVALEDIVQDAHGRIDYERSIVRIRNSWSESFGDQGCFRASLALLHSLRDQADYVQPRIEGGAR